MESEYIKTMVVKTTETSVAITIIMKLMLQLLLLQLLGKGSRS